MIGPEFLGLVFLLVLVATVGKMLATGLLKGSGEHDDPDGESGDAGPRLSLAVLPFGCLAEDLVAQHVLDGIHEELIGDLGRILGQEVAVTGRRSVMGFRGTKKQISEVATELGGVDVLLEGDVSQQDGTFRISLSLFDADSPGPIWTEGFEKKTSEVLNLFGEMAEAIAAHLKVEISRDERERLAGTREINTKAWDAYLQGRHYLNRLVDPEADLIQAIDFFEDAIQEDQNEVFAEAHAGLAMTYYVLTSLHLRPPTTTWKRIEEAARRATNIDSRLPEARLALAYLRTFNDWDWKEGEAEFRRILSANPSHVDGLYGYSVLLTILERFEEASQTAFSTTELDPKHPQFQLNIPLVQMYAGDSEGAMSLAGTLETIHPDWSMVPFLVGLIRGGRLELSSAIEAMNEAVKKSSNFDVGLKRAFLGHYLGNDGQKDEAWQQLTAFDDLEAAGQYVPPIFRALVLLGLQEKDWAMDLLEESSEARDPWMPFLRLWSESILPPLKNQARIKRLIGYQRLPKR